MASQAKPMEHTKNPQSLREPPGGADADPVVGAVKNMAALYEQHTQHDEDHMEAIRAGLKSLDDEDSLGGEVLRQVYMIEDKIVSMQATSLAGALGQLILAASLFDFLTALDDDSNRQEVAVKIVPLLWSIRRVLERESGASSEDFGARHYMADHLNPFRDGTERLSGGAS